MIIRILEKEDPTIRKTLIWWINSFGGRITVHNSRNHQMIRLVDCLFPLRLIIRGTAIEQVCPANSIRWPASIVKST
jgi:hypothetical protein